MPNVFPLFNHEQAFARVAAHWRIDDTPLPLPRFQPQCCGGEVLLKDWRYHHRKTGSANPYRVDVRFKCLWCSRVWAHGIVVTREQYEARPSEGAISWRAGLELLQQKGIVNNQGAHDG